MKICDWNLIKNGGKKLNIWDQIIWRNKTGADQFQDCSKNWNLTPDFCYYGQKKVDKRFKFNKVE